MSSANARKTIHSPDSAAESRRPAGLTPSAFALFTAGLWGGNNVSIKVALQHGSPMQIGWLRFVLGAIVTVAYMVVRREPFLKARRLHR